MSAGLRVGSMSARRRARARHKPPLLRRFPERNPQLAVNKGQSGRVNFASFQSEVFTRDRQFPLEFPPSAPNHEGFAMSFRRDYITKPIFSFARGVLPPMSDTEREALEAGDVWWDADLFTGDPDWSKLLAYPPATLTDEEKAFLHGPVDELCVMLDDWKI